MLFFFIIFLLIDQHIFKQVISCLCVHLGVSLEMYISLLRCGHFSLCVCLRVCVCVCVCVFGLPEHVSPHRAVTAPPAPPPSLLLFFCSSQPTL